ncbi:aminodeoxychorismate lyase [Paraglaciecola hydrolytica]|uniref:aminodeoxychorismate lyase n=1 Tax=Paraglaciecola hydrolytica TaxID=1799789 RepID=UPI0009EA8C6C|nr:aminodeoxychorismate lyase [Paraglaciecola hydrolytica]
MIIINGQFQDKIDVAERALQYGDGCFTTMAFSQNKLLLWPLHLARLQNNCQRLAINFLQWQALHESALNLIAQSEHKNGVIKIIISRGKGGRGYSPLNVSESSYIVSLHTLPVHYAGWQQQGIKLGLSPVKLAIQPLLAGLKHLNRLEQVLIKQALDLTEFDDVLVCDSNDNIIEASAANVFWLHKGQWFTPMLDGCGVAGVMRRTICQMLAAQSQPVKEIHQIFTLDFAAEEMFICNALMAIVPVTTLSVPMLNQQWTFSHSKVAQLQTELNIFLQTSLS